MFRFSLDTSCEGQKPSSKLLEPIWNLEFLFAGETKKPPPGMIRKWRFFLVILVGATGFEPATSATPLQRATKLRHAPSISHLREPRSERGIY
jgi:hypothetical protein